jgi:hypothetical protein
VSWIPSGNKVPSRAGSHLPYMPEQQERIERRVEKLPEAPGCWIWMGPISKRTGYPEPISVKDKTKRVQRVAYAAFRGEVPANSSTDHLCRVKECVNPWHLEIVTTWENTKRSGSLTARNAAKTHCRHGHEFTEDNTIRTVDERGKPHRQCYECIKQFNLRKYRTDPVAARERKRAWYAANPEKYRAADALRRAKKKAKKEEQA